MSIVEKEPVVSVLPFTVEADHPRNQDLKLRNIPNGRLRGALNGSKPTKSKGKKGKTIERIPKDQARHLGMLGDVPGMQITVCPAKLTYKIEDPLYEDDDACEQINQGLFDDDRILDIKSQGIEGVDTAKGKLDVHQMKTLCRELFNLSEMNHVKIIKGVIPKMKDIDKLPGHYITNPGSPIPYGQPRFEKDLGPWSDQLNQRGGGS